MNIVQLGGLGNQMFIYALYYSMKRRGCNVKIDASVYNWVKMHNGYELPNVFGLEQPEVKREGFYLKWMRFLLHFRPKFLVYDETFERNLNVFKQNRFYITGYWQSDMYFQEYKEELLRIYTFKNVSQRNLEISLEMQKKSSVSLHIRRGDYLDIPGALNICSKEYYQKAIEFIRKKVENPHFYIFSNDTIWSREFAQELGIEFTIIDHNTGVDSFQDMYLMTQCKHNILANSSFSWWGAYLNQHHDAIRVAPYNWCQGHSEETLKTDTPSDWFRI